MMKTTRVILRIFFFFSILMMIPSCAINPVTGKKQFVLMTEAQEAQMGLQYDPMVIATFGEYAMDDMLLFVREKTTEMGKISHRPKIVYHIKILDSPVVNAFAVPGGYIYLTRGILAQLNNEAELMGVIGHEMGHITARHSVSQQSRQQLGQLLLVGGMIVSPEFAQYAQVAMQGMQLLFLKFSRENEMQADSLGVEYSSKIGYDAHKMADFFQVLEKMSMAESQGGVPTFLSTHPDPGDRYNSVNRKASSWQRRLSLPEWKVNQDSYYRLIDGMVYGEDPRQGYVSGNTFYHPQLKFSFSFPQGWKVENQPTQVNIAREDGKALIVFTLAPQRSLQTAADSILGNLGLEILERKSLRVNDFPALAVRSKQTLQSQSTNELSANLLLSYFIEYGGSIYVFHGVSAEADFAACLPLFEATMTSFARLSDAARINVKPKKILVRKVEKGGTATEIFRQYQISEAQMKELALLNNIELTDKLSAGKLIKIVGQ